MKKSLKKILCVVLSMLMMFAFMSVISFAGDGDVTELDPGTPGFETIVNLVKGLIANIDWESVIAAVTTAFKVITNLMSGLLTTAA